MKKFEIGKEYFDRSACNHDCIFTIKIIKRTEKTVAFSRWLPAGRVRCLTLYRGGGFRRSVSCAVVSVATV